MTIRFEVNSNRNPASRFQLFSANGAPMVAAMVSVEMDSVLLRLRKGDHVGVLKQTLKGGTELVHGSESLTTAGTIPAGHKIALKDLKALLKKFVKEEDYESVAKVRDELSLRKKG